MKRHEADTRLTGWAWFIERMYRLTHGGQIRTLVLSRDQIRVRDYGLAGQHRPPSASAPPWSGAPGRPGRGSLPQQQSASGHWGR